MNSFRETPSGVFDSSQDVLRSMAPLCSTVLYCNEVCRVQSGIPSPQLKMRICEILVNNTSPALFYSDQFRAAPKLSGTTGNEYSCSFLEFHL